MQDGISSTPEFSSEPEDIGNVIISLNHCLCEELDLKIADNVYIFFILCSLEKRLLYFWKFGKKTAFFPWEK